MNLIIAQVQTKKQIIMSPKGYHHVTRDLRCQIFALKARGKSLRTMASQLGVSASTLCRELKRNQDSQGYCYERASKAAMNRRH